MMSELLQGLLDHLNKGGSVRNFERRIRGLFECSTIRSDGNSFWYVASDSSVRKKINFLYMRDNFLDLFLEECATTLRGIPSDGKFYYARLRPKGAVYAIRYDIEKGVLAMQGIPPARSNNIWTFSGDKVGNLYIME